MTSAAVAHNLNEKPRTGDVLISENVNFDGLLLSEPILKGLKAAGFERPSPIQLKAIPLGRCGLDLIVQAKSGTGKTCVFSVIALEGLQLDTSALQVLVLAPTREIAIQIWDVIKSIGQALSQLKCHTFIGGMPLQEDKQKLKKCHIAVGTPGRIKQLIEQGIMNIENIRMFILDEADKLLEDSFQEQINWIYSTLPDNKQMLALSATYPEYLAQHLTAYMRNPTFLRLNVSDPALLGIKQYYKSVKFHPLPNKLFENKVEVVTTILSSVDFQQCLVFSNLQTMAQNMADALNSKGWPTACIAGSLDQKDRNLAMSKLKTFKCRVLISTDLTSRGIDADKVNLVINLDVPKDHETYLHRIGRAGRFGTFGACISVVSDGQEMVNLQSVEKKCNTCITLLPDQIPVDLVKTQGTINLDDMVSTEKIFTSPENGDPSKFIHKQEVALSESPAVLTSAINHDVVNGDQGAASRKQTVCTNEGGDSLFTKSLVESENQKDCITVEKNQTKGSKQSDEVVDKLKQLSVNGESSQRKAFLNVDIDQVNRSSKQEMSDDKQVELNGRTETTKIKPKPKKHSTGSFWTQLILERNDDEEFVQEFQASQREDDIFDLTAEVGNESLDMIADDTEPLKHKVAESPDMLTDDTEPLKHKVAKRRNDCKKTIDSNITASEEFTNSKDILSSLQKMNGIKVKIPLLKETIGLKRLGSPHTYETAKENLLSHTDTAKLSEKIGQVKISEIDQKATVNIGKTVGYDQHVLQKVNEILALSPLHVQRNLNFNKMDTKIDENAATKQNTDSRSRKTIKGRRNKQNKFSGNGNKNLSKQEEEVKNIEQYSLKQTSTIPYNSSDYQRSHEKENLYLQGHQKENLKPIKLDERVVRPKQRVDNIEGKKDVGKKRPEITKYGSDDRLFEDFSEKCDWNTEGKKNESKKRPEITKYGSDDRLFEDFDKKYGWNTEGKKRTEAKKYGSEDRLFDDFSEKYNCNTEGKKMTKEKTHASDNRQFDNFSENYGHKVKDDVISSLSESESSDSSESSDYSEYNEDKRYSKSNYSQYAKSKNREKQNSKYSQYPKYYGSKEQTHDSYHDYWKRRVETESDTESEYATDPWAFYHHNQYDPSQQFGYPYCYPPNPFMNVHSNPYMNGYNPYSFYNPWQYPHYQMPQPSGFSYETLYKNLENQQKYIKMMLKRYRKMMSRD